MTQLSVQLIEPVTLVKNSADPTLNNPSLGDMLKVESSLALRIICKDQVVWLVNQVQSRVEFVSRQVATDETPFDRVVRLLKDDLILNNLSLRQVIPWDSLQFVLRGHIWDIVSDEGINSFRGMCVRGKNVLQFVYLAEMHFPEVFSAEVACESASGHGKLVFVPEFLLSTTLTDRSCSLMVPHLLKPSKGTDQ